jgi:hypothetical protein
MKSEIYFYRKGWNKQLDASMDSKQTLIVLFSSIDEEKQNAALDDLHKTFPESYIIGCSSSGEIYQEEIYHQTMSVMVIQLERSSMRLVSVSIDDFHDAYKAGKELARQLLEKDLRHIFLLSGGWEIDGTILTDGINALLPSFVSATGGVAGDNIGKGESWILYNNGVGRNRVAAIGFYGSFLQIGYGCQAGWDRLGLERKVTHIEGKELFTLDDKPALEIYKQYLGAKAKDLPTAAHLFPLAILNNRGEEVKIREVFNINESHQSLILNDLIQEGTYVSLMFANFNRLVEGAYQAAKEAYTSEFRQDLDTAVIAISCIGRKQLMRQRTEEEIQAVLEALPPNSHMIGFYSNGEISPSKNTLCSLHNQTMTLTVIQES